MPKLVKGANFVTIEDTKDLSEEELADLITNWMEQPFTKRVSHLNILVNSKFSTEIDLLLMEHGFNKHDEVVTVHKELVDESNESPNTFKYIQGPSHHLRRGIHGHLGTSNDRVLKPLFLEN